MCVLGRRSGRECECCAHVGHAQEGVFRWFRKRTIIGAVVSELSNRRCWTIYWASRLCRARAQPEIQAGEHCSSLCASIVHLTGWIVPFCTRVLWPIITPHRAQSCWNAERRYDTTCFCVLCFCALCSRPFLGPVQMLWIELYDELRVFGVCLL